MNADDLRALVARSIDAEQATPPPPPDLLERARAARGRRRLAVVGVAATVVLTAAAVGIGFVRPAEDPPEVPRPAATDGIDELAQGAEPCPSVLPPSQDVLVNSYLGTIEPAGRSPRLAPPDAAWVCRYDVFGNGQSMSQGYLYEWRQSAMPLRLDESRLARVAELQAGVVQLEQGETAGCRSDLGPRWLLVTAHEGDLTGVQVDDFGCEDVRLTGQPAEVAAGDPQDDGTVSGIFASPEGMVETLEGWWREAEPSPPDELQVRCTDAGPELESRTVAAQAGGVVVVVESTLPRNSYLTYDSAGDGPSGGDLARGTTTYAFPPGEVKLGCASPPGMDSIGEVVVDVVDPADHWREETLADFGCEDSGAVLDSNVGAGPTAEAAMDDLLAGGRAALTAERVATGYIGSEVQTWVVTESGVVTLGVEVYPDNTGYVAAPEVLCTQ